MDSRLESIISEEPDIRFFDLCANALLCARDDSSFYESDDVGSQFLGAHLAHVLDLGLTNWGFLLSLEQPQSLNQYLVPVMRKRDLIQLGDRCIFDLSLQHALDRLVYDSSTKRIITTGQLAYSAAAANSNGWSHEERDWLSHLSNRFGEYCHLLSQAERLLGFSSDPDARFLINISRCPPEPSS